MICINTLICLRQEQKLLKNKSNHPCENVQLGLSFTQNLKYIRLMLFEIFWHIEAFNTRFYSVTSCWRPHCDFEMNSNQSAVPLLRIYLYVWDFCVMNVYAISPFSYLNNIFVSWMFTPYPPFSFETLRSLLQANQSIHLRDLNWLGHWRP